MKSKNSPAKINPKDKKFRYRKYTKTQALDAMREFKNEILCGQHIEEASATYALISDHVANYLLEAFYLISHEVNANVALRLPRQKGGHMKKRARDIDIVLFVDNLRSSGMGKEEAIAQAAPKYHLSTDGIDSAYKRAEGDAKFYEQCKDEFGEEFAKEWLEHLRESRRVKL